jgi:hypothetical protein
MTTRTTSIVIILLMAITTSYAQSFEPLDLAQKIFSKDSLANISKYTTGEYQGKPNGQDFPPDITKKFSLLQQTADKAVVVMTVSNQEGATLDTYLHFAKDTTWKMCAFRSLAMTGMIEQMIIELEKMTPQQIDKQIEQAKKSKKDDDEDMIKSKEDYDFLLGNAKLTITSDEKIIQHFEANKAAFEQLKEKALKELASRTEKEEGRTRLLKNEKGACQKLLISSVAFGDYELGGNCLSFLIGGILDNTVGYLYVKDKKDAPAMHADRIIMIKEISNGWYIYKTT